VFVATGSLWSGVAMLSWPKLPSVGFSSAFPVLIPKGWQAGQNGAAFPRGRAAFIFVAASRNQRKRAGAIPRTGPLPCSSSA
jgi:hypothetical protein